MKKHAALVLFFISLFIAVSASARQLTGPPPFGFVWNDSDGKLRPLLGVPGNTTVGEVRNTEIAIVQAFSLNGQHFLASTDSSSSLHLINAATIPVSATPIAAAPAQPSAIAGSRTGTAAALYYADQQRVLIFTGLLATPKVSYTIDVSVTGQVSRMAISDDGSLLLYSVSQGSDAGRDALFGWTPSGGYRMLTTSDSISAIAFTPTGDALIADAQTNEVFSLRQPKGDAVRYFVADTKIGVSNPVGVAATDNGQIYVANAGSGSILTLDSNGVLLRSQQCYCEIGGLFPLKNSLYRLSGRTDGTLYLLEASATGGRVVFVPPYRKNQ